MSRKMYISDEMGLDESISIIASKNVQSALIWPWIIPYFDDWGRAECSPARIKGKLFPLVETVTRDMIQRALTDFVIEGLITIYEEKGSLFMSIDSEKWFRYQSHIHASKRSDDRSRIPAPTDEDVANCAELRDIPRDQAETRASLLFSSFFTSFFTSPHQTREVASCEGRGWRGEFRKVL